MFFFFAFLFFLIGLLSSLFSPFLLFLTLLPFSYLLFYRKEKKTFVFLLFTMLGFLLVFLLPRGNLDACTLEGIVIERKDTYCIVLSWHGKYYLSDKEGEFSLFDFIHVEGYVNKISITHYESIFNFREYLKTKGVFYEFKKKNSSIYFKNPISNVPLKNYLFHYLSEDGRIFFASLLCGDSISNLSVSKNFDELGILSALSLSGFHISFLFSSIQFFLKEKQKKKFFYFEFPFLFLLLFLSGWKYSIRRIFLMHLLSFLNQKRKWGLLYLDRISIIAFLLLFFEPYSLLNGAFYYPFPLLFFLALFQKKDKKEKRLFAILIFLFFLPYRMMQNPRFHFLSPLLSLFFIPISHLLFLSTFLLFLIPQFGIVPDGILSILFYLSDKMASVPFYAIVGTPGIVFLILYYLFFAAIFVFRQYHFGKYQKISSLSLCAVILTTFLPDILPHNSVTFLDVGQGDSTLVRYKNYNFLIDTGGNVKIDLAEECLIPYLEKKKIRKLDMVIITHPDYDHNGALESLKNNFIVENTYTQDDFLLMENNILDFHGLLIKDYNLYGSYGDKSDNNLNSGVYQFTIKGKTFLIMGDAPKEIEYKIIKDHPELRCDVIKIGHHGSNTSSSMEFLSQVSPSLAVISCGENNRYNHPHKETIRTLEALKIPYVRTDEVSTYTYRL